MVDFWHKTADSTDEVKKFNHRSGRYAVWGRLLNGRELWEIRDGQGPQGHTIRASFATKAEGMREAENIIRSHEHAERAMPAGR